MNTPKALPARCKELLEYEPLTGAFRWRVARPGRVAGTPAGGKDGAKGYIKICVDGVSYPAHRVAWAMVTGSWPDALIDHKNGIVDDNRWSNLRAATAAENARNRKRDRDSTSGHKGAYWDKSINRWKGGIRVRGKLIYLGVFDTPEEAHAAYAEAAKKHFGAFARVS